MIRLAPVILLALAAPVLAQTSRPPAELGLDPFYEKYVDGGGVPVIGSRRVDDRAFAEAAAALRAMMSRRPDVVRAMVARGAMLGIVGATEQTTDLPGHHDLNEAFPDQDWDLRTRGVGGTPERPLASVGEENLLGASEDRYRGESILVHEFGHSVLTLGLAGDVKDGLRFADRLSAAFEAARSEGLWADTYAATNADEYWAEGIQSWFDANLEADPADGVHGPVDTRAELRAHDPRLAELLAEVFPDDGWRPRTSERPPVAPGDRIDLRVVNRSTSRVNVQWIDGSGALVPYAELAPGEEWTCTSYPGHGWVATCEGRRRRTWVVPPSAASTWTVAWPGEDLR